MFSVDSIKELQEDWVEDSCISGIGKINKEFLPSEFKTLDASYANLRKRYKRYVWKHSTYRKH